MRILISLTSWVNSDFQRCPRQSMTEKETWQLVETLVCVFRRGRDTGTITEREKQSSEVTTHSTTMLKWCVCVNIFAVYPQPPPPKTTTKKWPITTERGCNLFTRDILLCWGQFVGASQHMDCVLVWSSMFVWLFWGVFHILHIAGQ